MFHKKETTFQVILKRLLATTLASNERRNYWKIAKPKPNRSRLKSVVQVMKPFYALLYAVFFQVPHTPIKLLTVPAKPTIPSSKFRYARAVLGIVKSQRSEISCKLIKARSLQFSISHHTRDTQCRILASGFSCSPRHPPHYSCRCSAPSVSAATECRGLQLR